MERKEVIESISQILAKKEIHQVFHPIIKEFFVRAAQQYSWQEEELQRALESFDYLESIRFDEIKTSEDALNEIIIYGTGETEVNEEGESAEYCKLFAKNDIIIKTIYLNKILEQDIDEIEKFINNIMHELGHAIKIRIGLNKRIEVGLCFTTEQDYTSHSVIMNEFAEIISAEKLQKGNLKAERYDYYTYIQNAARAVIYALGLTEEDIFSLQWEGRAAYENAIAVKLEGIPSNVYIASLEMMLDTIFSDYNKGDKSNVVLQVKVLNEVINKLFQERFLVIKEKMNISQLAELSIHQKRCNIALPKMLQELELEDDVEIKLGQEIDSLLEEDRTITNITELKQMILEEENRILQREEKRKEREWIVYDNTQLRESVYNSLSKYPIRLLPKSKRLGMIKSKIIGWSKNVFGVKRKVKSPMQEEKEESYVSKHSQFAKRMADLAKQRSEKKFSPEVVETEMSNRNLR